MTQQTTYWTARETKKGRWTFEDGWTEQRHAEDSAKHYRREYRRRCVVVPVKDGDDRGEALLNVLHPFRISDAEVQMERAFAELTEPQTA